jgi:cytochrome P450
MTSQVLAYGIAIVTYRKFFHPLRHFPGPPLCTISKLPAFYLAWTGKKVPFLEKAHREYGDIVRINPDELSIIGADVWKDTHGRSTKFQDAKGPLPKHWEKNVHSPNGVYNLFDAPDAEHARMRKRFSPAFSERALQKQQALFQEVADRFITKLSAQMGEKIDLVRMLNFTTFDIMSELAFGDSLNMLERNEYCPWVRVMFDFIKIDARMKAMGQLMSPLQALARVLFGGYIEKKKSDHFRFSEERVSHRLKVGSEKADIWNLLLKPKEHMESLTKGEMDSNAFVLMIAGTETVATVLAGLIYFMLKNPAKMDHLTNEVRNAFHGTDPITLKGVNKLQYLSACIEETLRLYPPTPTGTARAVPNPGSTICGSFIPGGVRLVHLCRLRR